MKSKLYNLDPITSRIDRFAWIFWAILWISLSLGLGHEDLVYSARGILEIPEIITILIVFIMWLSVLLQVIRQAFFNYPKPLLAKLGNWFLIGASTLFTFRLTWILLIKDYIIHISPIILLGAALMGVGLILNAIVGIKYADSLSYGVSINDK